MLLAYDELIELIDDGVITGADKDNVNPTSIDIREDYYFIPFDAVTEASLLY